MAICRIYLDNCCFNRPYDDQTQERIYLESLAKLYIQQLIVDGKVDFVWSYVMEYENSKNPYEIRRKSIRDFSYRCVNFIDSSKNDQIVAIAKEIMCTGIKEKDAMHLGCALLSECEYFITTDDRLLKYKTEEIKLVEPITFIKEMEDKL